ncbi:hypothetical protein M0804_013450 [Polistes exclamans]|nr:hypothetical protein M0804_013450 [Polistes exclamans]
MKRKEDDERRSERGMLSDGMPGSLNMHEGVIGLASASWDRCLGLVEIRSQFCPTMKIVAKYLGPYKVTRVIGNHRYEMKHIGKAVGPRIKTIAANYMKLYQPENESQSSRTEDLHNGRV